MREERLSRRDFLKAMGIAAAASAVPSWVRVRAATKPRPNVLLIVADDLGYGDLGCYGQKKILTPNIDKLAEEGTRFTQCYAGSTVCAPSRCSLMTGMHNGHNRLRDNLPHNIWLRPDDVTVAEVLKQAGYKTGAIGKWALGDPGSWGVPNYQGFDYWYGHLKQDLAIYYYPTHLWENDRIVMLQDLVMVNDVGKMIGNRAGKRIKYTHDLFTEKAVSFIERHSEDPFFLYLAYTLPHFSDYPADSPDHYMVPSDEPYTDKDWPQIARNYAAMISRVDRDVGRIMELLRKLGVDENTIVFFTSDNGAYLGSAPPREFFNSNGVLRGGKRDLYEGGIRVPMIARWPGKVPAGRVSSQVWAFWDFLPTAAELAGLPVPEDIDGLSMLPALLGRPQKSHDYLYWDYGHVRKTFKQAVRVGNWKGVRIGAHTPVELYNLKKDAGETRNIASKHPQIVSKIEQIMRTAPASCDDYPIGRLVSSQ
ncbi:MAG: arylsulfatase [Planctomycetota bacterium]|jgi:arylsulfatase A-like enzyme